MASVVQSSSLACLRVPEGFGIGYESTLATAAECIELKAGTHFLLARNGRGKTTLLKTLSGLLKPTDGRFELDGQPQFVSDELSYDRELTPAHVFSAFLSGTARKAAMVFSEHLELDVRKPFGKLSFGNRKKVGLVVAEFSLAGDGSDVMFYDEPFTGLDTPAREALLSRWRESEDQVMRIVSCHPDLDEMTMPSAMLISDGRLGLPGAGATTWSELKKLLN
jgi:ABC-type multidrug transport system ATPase subunit